MKKILTFIAFILILNFSLFASQSALKVNGNVDKDPFHLSLGYDLGSSVIDIEDFYNLTNNGEDFDLTKNGSTNDFIIYVSGNESIVPNFGFSVSHPGFTPVNKENAKKTDNVPVKFKLVKHTSLRTGYHEKSEKWRFKLYWEGNPDLTAGRYSTTIRVHYAIR